MNTITIELCAEDRARLDRILEALAGAPVSASCEQVKTEPEAAKTPAPEEKSAPAASFGRVTEPEKAYTQDELTALVRKLIAPGSAKRAKAKAIVSAYAPKVSGIPPEKYTEVMQQLLALDKEG